MYGLLNCNEWTRRGYKDTMTPRFQAVLEVSSSKERFMPPMAPIMVITPSCLSTVLLEYWLSRTYLPEL